MFSDDELLRYSRHILLPQIDIEGQAKLKKSHVVTVGCGGLGNFVAPILASAGVHKITLIDFDKIELSNLQRQVTFKTADIGEKKSTVLANYLYALNPEIEINALDITLEKTFEIDPNLFESANAILDCTDNFQTRHLINQLSIDYKIPLISGSAVRFEGQLAIFDPTDKNSACYACLFDGADTNDGECATFGVFSPVLSIIGTLQAQETLKLLLDMPVLKNTLILYNGYSLSFEKIKFGKNPKCRVCSC